MAIRYDVNINATAYNQFGTIDWGKVSRKFQDTELQGVTLGNKVDNDRKIQVAIPPWPDNNKVWSVFLSDVIETTINPDGGDVDMPPGEVAFRWRDAQGNIVIEQVYVKKDVG